MYSEKLAGLSNLGTPGPAVVTATGVLAHRYCAAQGLKVFRVQFVVTTSVVSTGAVTIVVKKRPLVGSATGEVALATLIVPAASVAGDVIYKDVSANSASGNHFDPGQELAFDVTVAAAGGGAAGAGIGLVECEEDPEFAGNQARMIASA